MRTEHELEMKLSEKKSLLKNVRESLSADLKENKIDEHPAVLTQGYYIRALQWALGKIDEL
jgi:5-bromo-4-chloroindolyl phosphate hydrolysis protein